MQTWILFNLDGGLDHILIDEAQDTNPEQWRIISALTEDFFSGEGASETPLHEHGEPWGHPGQFVAEGGVLGEEAPMQG